MYMTSMAKMDRLETFCIFFRLRLQTQKTKMFKLLINVTPQLKGLHFIKEGGFIWGQSLLFYCDLKNSGEDVGTR